MNIKDIITEGVVRDYHMSDWKAQTGLPEEVIEAYGKMGSDQRGWPERYMVDAQKMHSGVLNGVIEHVGDLTNRMSPMHSFQFSYGSGKEKVDKTLRTLTRGYGFRREFEENLVSYIKGNNLDPDEYQQQLEEALKKYADAHMKLEAHCDLHVLARGAAIALGRFQFDKAANMLSIVQQKLSTIETYREAIQDFNQ